MAEETNNINTSTSTEPSVADLQAQLAEALADRDRHKASVDKLSKSEAEMKKQLREKMSAEEQAAQERAEAQRIADEEREAMRKELNQIKAERAYVELSDEKSVKKLIDAVSNADHTAIAGIIKAEIEAGIKRAEAEWLNNRPPVSIGTGGAKMTKEEIFKIPNREERRKAIQENLDLFD